MVSYVHPCMYTYTLLCTYEPWHVCTHIDTHTHRIEKNERPPIRKKNPDSCNLFFSSKYYFTFYLVHDLELLVSLGTAVGVRKLRCPRSLSPTPPHPNLFSSKAWTQKDPAFGSLFRNHAGFVCSLGAASC